jgi:predicted RND superfamily exporter protein
VRTTGQAIGFTASTLVVGVVFWIPVSSLRFSAETSLLLSILMVVNAVGAVLLVPSLIRLLPEALAKRSRFSG